MSKSDALWYAFVGCYVAAAVCFFAAMVLLGYILAGDYVVFSVVDNLSRVRQESGQK